MKTVFVTGANGFVGKHLVRCLHEKGVNVVGVGRGQVPSLEIKDLLHSYYPCDLTNIDEVNRVPWVEADAVINLAGLAQVGASFSDPELYAHVNVGVLANLLENIAASGSFDGRVIAVSSGAVYDPLQPMPLIEDSKLTTSGSPYAMSKIMMEEKAREYMSRGIRCIIARPFNHTGPGQETGFLVPDLIAKIKNSLATGEPVVTGDLSRRRDFTDVRDVAKAYADLAFVDIKNLTHDTYNICSGVSRSGQDILNEIIRRYRGSDRLDFRVDEKLIRPNDPAELLGSNQLLVGDTNWAPTYSMPTTIRDSLVDLGLEF